VGLPRVMVQAVQIATNDPSLEPLAVKMENDIKTEMESNLASSPVLYADAFDQDQGWWLKPAEKTDFIIKEGVLIAKSKKAYRNTQIYSPVNSNDMNRWYSVEVEVKSTNSDTAKYGLVFEYDRVSDDQLYVFNVDIVENKVYLRKYVDEWVVIDKTAAGEIGLNETNNKLKVVRQGRRIKGYVNGQLAVEAVDISYEGGEVGLYAGARSAEDGFVEMAKVEFDNFAVRDGRGDMNADGVIDALDVNLLQNWYGK